METKQVKANLQGRPLAQANIRSNRTKVGWKHSPMYKYMMKSKAFGARRGKIRRPQRRQQARRLARQARREAIRAQQCMRKAQTSKSLANKGVDKAKAMAHSIRAVGATMMAAALDPKAMRGMNRGAGRSMGSRMASSHYYKRFHNPRIRERHKRMYMNHVKRHANQYNIPTVSGRMPNGKIKHVRFYAQAFKKSPSQHRMEHHVDPILHHDKNHVAMHSAQHGFGRGARLSASLKRSSRYATIPTKGLGDIGILTGHALHKGHHKSHYRMKAPNANINRTYQRQHFAQKKNAANLGHGLSTGPEMGA